MKIHNKAILICGSIQLFLILFNNQSLNIMLRYVLIMKKERFEAIDLANNWQQHPLVEDNSLDGITGTTADDPDFGLSGHDGWLAAHTYL